MLTGYQVETVAFTGGDDFYGIVHPQCAAELTTTVAVAKAERGLSSGYALQPLIRFTLDEIISENASEWASQEIEYDEDPDAWNAEYERVAEYGYPCDHCGLPIT